MDHDEPSTARPPDSAPLLGGNPGTPGLREPFAPQAGPRNPWPTIIGMITTLSVIVIVLFMVL